MKNMALLAHITTEESNTRPIERLCHDLGVLDARRMTGEEIHAKDSYLVFLNGLILGMHKKPQELVDNLNRLHNTIMTIVHDGMGTHNREGKLYEDLRKEAPGSAWTPRKLSYRDYPEEDEEDDGTEALIEHYLGGN